MFDKSEWSRSTSESELMFRRTSLEESGVTVTTHSCGVFEMSAGEALLFVTRIAGMQARDNRSPTEPVRSMRRWNGTSATYRNPADADPAVIATARRVSATGAT